MRRIPEAGETAQVIMIDRVLVDSDGSAIPAIQYNGPAIETVYVRQGDGWTLGVPANLEVTADQMWDWAGSWRLFTPGEWTWCVNENVGGAMKENFILTVHFYPSGTMFLDIDATREEAKDITQQRAREWQDVSVAVTAHQQTSPQIKEWYIATARTYCLIRDRKPLELYIQALRAARERRLMFEAGKAGEF